MKTKLIRKPAVIVAAGATFAAIVAVSVQATRRTARRAWPATRFRIFERGHSARVTNSLLSHNNYGIVSNGTGSTFSGNKVLNNAYDGVYLAGSGTTLTSNVAQGNALVGIRDVGSATTLTKNIADYNGDDGIVAGADLFVVDGGGQ